MHLYGPIKFRYLCKKICVKEYIIENRIRMGGTEYLGPKYIIDTY